MVSNLLFLELRAHAEQVAHLGGVVKDDPVGMDFSLRGETGF